MRRQVAAPPPMDVKDVDEGEPIGGHELYYLMCKRLSHSLLNERALHLNRYAL
jgi:hypothetical protein